MKRMFAWILIGMVFVSVASLAHEVEEMEDHDKINYNLEEFYLPIIVVLSIIGTIIYNLKNSVGEEVEES